MKLIVYSKDALKALRRMPSNVAALIRSKIETDAAHPADLANQVIALEGMSGVLRLRVGDWHVIFTDDGEVIAIIKIASRGAAYT